jgi:hypothetical protein
MLINIAVVQRWNASMQNGRELSRDRWVIRAPSVESDFLAQPVVRQIRDANRLRLGATLLSV